MKHIDLFSGIGGFALAARSVGWETVAFCETDEFCRGIVERRFDRVRWISLPRPVAGGAALGSARDEIIAGLDPDWLVIENTGHRWRAWMPELRRRLFDLGYASLPIRVRASNLGGAHARARGFVIANADGDALRKFSWWWLWAGRQMASELADTWDSKPRGLGADDGLPDWVDRRRSLGNAVCPLVAEIIFTGISEVTRES